MAIVVHEQQHDQPSIEHTGTPISSGNESISQVEDAPRSVHARNSKQIEQSNDHCYSHQPISTSFDDSIKRDKEIPCVPIAKKTLSISIPPLLDENATDTIETSMQTSKVGPQNFEKIRILGAGSTGRVYLVKSVGLGPEEFFAMKVVKKSELIKKNRVQRILTEKQILSVASHPFVVTLHYTFQTDNYFYFIMQYCAGGEFFSFLKRQKYQRLSEDQAKFYAAEVLIALEYLHLLGIIYRDLKPENILVHESGHVMLSDFDLAQEVKSNTQVGVSPVNCFKKKRRSGFGSYHSGLSMPMLRTTSSQSSIASTVGSSTDENLLWFRIVDKKPASHTKPPSRLRGICPTGCGFGGRISYPMMDTESHMEQGEKRMSFVGTHEYVAPEIVAEEGYMGSVDWWAFGILLYEMIYSTTPFKGQTQLQTLENILDLREEIDFPSDTPVSEEFKDLVRKLLSKTVSKRLQNPIHIKAHPFFTGIVWSLVRNQKPPITPTFVHALQEREFSEEQIRAFDDEVPYVKGSTSPNTPRRVAQSPSTSKLPSSSTPTHQSQPTHIFTSNTELGAVQVPCTNNIPEQTPQLSLCLTSSSCTMMVSAQTSDPETPSGDLKTAIAPTNTLSNREIEPSNTAIVTLQDFDYSAKPKLGYWNSSESKRTLNEKLSEMRLAVPENS